jgi:hypothetical protein
VCASAESMRQLANSRPRKTSRKRGVRARDDPARVARWKQAYKFNRLGISETTFTAMLKAQGHACAMCKTPFAEGKRIFTDHDRSCCPKDGKDRAKTCGKCIRGLLCFRCNIALGYIELFREIADEYLARAAATRSA